MQDVEDEVRVLLRTLAGHAEVRPASAGDRELGGEHRGLAEDRNPAFPDPQRRALQEPLGEHVGRAFGEISRLGG